MIGIDSTKISRFQKPTQAFLVKVLHPNEFKAYEKSLNKDVFLAARWAIKEALYKIDNSLREFSKIDIIKQDKRYFYEDYVISTSSEGDIYTAVVLKGNKWK